MITDEPMIEYKDLHNPLGNREYRRKMLAILNKKQKEKSKLEKKLRQVDSDIFPLLKFAE